MTQEQRTYEGKCHCGSVQFQFTGEPITGAMRCNCSICRRKNAIMSREYYPPERFKLLSGADDLAVYRFGDHDVNHNFCKHCGVYPFHDVVDKPAHGRRVNFGCVDEIDANALPIRVFDGRDTWKYLDEE